MPEVNFENDASLVQYVGKLLSRAISSGASDIHFRAHQMPMGRIGGELVPLAQDSLGVSLLETLVARMLPPRLRESANNLDQLDFSAEWPGISRFRVHCFRSRGEPALVLRIIPLQIPDFNTLRLPAAIKRACQLERGLFLVTGATGMGKSTTVASALSFIAAQRRAHILTLEDPIEFIIPPGQSLVSQREIGKDLPDFVSGLWSALRQDPDVIFIGEIRDAQAARVTLLAAETGHLVISTIHTSDAASTVEHLITLFPPEEQASARLRLSNVLEAVFCQRLLPMKSRHQRVLACEVMFKSPSVQEWIRRGDKARVLSERIAMSVADGMQTLDMDLKRLYESGQIELEVARAASPSPSEFMRNLALV